MFCRGCGTENADTSSTCTACGATLTNPFQATVTETPDVTSEKPSNYLVLAVISNLCCCPIFGVVAVIYAAQVDVRWNAGDRAGAVTASKNAFKWSCIALGIGILANLAFFALQFLAVASTNVNVQ